jgi:hypothetical protein
VHESFAFKKTAIPYEFLDLMGSSSAARAAHLPSFGCCISQQLNVEPDDLSIVLDADSFVPAMNPLQVVLLQAHRDEPKAVFRDLLVMLGVGARDHQTRRDYRIWEHLPNGSV